jgi:hypothetical protein
MGPDALSEYDDFVKGVAGSVADCLEFEHGSTNIECAGACIVHAHVHIIPGMGRYAQALDGIYPIAYRGPIAQMPLAAEPYIMLRSSFADVTAFSVRELPSQFIRHVICSNEGWSTWDWRSLPRDYLLKESLEYWGKNYDHTA